MAAVLAQAYYVPCGCKAVLSEKDLRAGIWRAVFGKLEFPLIHPLNHWAHAEGEHGDRFLKGDWEALSEEEKVKLAREMRKKFGVNEAAFMSQNRALGYIPIKDQNITVVCCQLHSRLRLWCSSFCQGKSSVC